MDLKPNTYYRTRDGSKAFYHGPDPFDQTTGVVCPKGRRTYRVFVKSGRLSPMFNDPGDLIEEWREPRTLTVEVVMTSGCGYVAVPPGHPWKGALARQRVTLTEGVFCEEHPQ